MDTFDEVFEFINSKIDSMVPNESDNAFIANGATLDDISASYSGKERSLVSMIIAHMMQNDDIRRIMTVAVKFYYEKHEDCRNLRRNSYEHIQYCISIGIITCYHSVSDAFNE